MHTIECSQTDTTDGRLIFADTKCTMLEAMMYDNSDNIKEMKHRTDISWCEQNHIIAW